MSVNIILILILANILGGLAWQLSKENQKEVVYLLVTSILSIVFLLLNVFAVEWIGDFSAGKPQGIVLAIISPISFIILMLIFGYIASKKELTNNKSFTEWLKKNFIKLLTRIAILSIYGFITLLVIFLIYFSYYGYDNGVFDIAEVANTLTLLGILTTLFGILISLYDRLK